MELKLKKKGKIYHHEVLQWPKLARKWLDSRGVSRRKLGNFPHVDSHIKMSPKQFKITLIVL